jgi:hypothetical protein
MFPETAADAPENVRRRTGLAATLTFDAGAIVDEVDGWRPPRLAPLPTIPDEPEPPRPRRATIADDQDASRFKRATDDNDVARSKRTMDDNDNTYFKRSTDDTDALHFKPSLNDTDRPRLPRRAATITFDAGTLPDDVDGWCAPRRTDDADSRCGRSQPPPDDADADTPIHSSGFYNIGDDIEFEEVPERRRPRVVVPRRVRARPAPRSKSCLSVELPPPPRATVSSLCERLRSAEWGEQNDAITELLAGADHGAGQLQGVLAGAVESLLECAASPRSILSKNALNCLAKWLAIGELCFDAIGERCANGLLSLVSAHHDKHFIADLAGHCFAALLAVIPATRAAAICVNEHRRKQDAGRACVAAATVELVPRLADCSALVKPVVALARDRNPVVRKAAKDAIDAMKGHVPDFDRFITQNVAGEEERGMLLREVR